MPSKVYPVSSGTTPKSHVYEVITASETWVRPLDVYYINAIVQGAGASGAVYISPHYGGGGGGSGAIIEVRNLRVTDDLTLSIGAGGAPAYASSGYDRANAGGTSSIVHTDTAIDTTYKKHIARLFNLYAYGGLAESYPQKGSAGGGATVSQYGMSNSDTVSGAGTSNGDGSPGSSKWSYES